MKNLIEVKCPSCSETIEIDEMTGQVVHHYKTGTVNNIKGDFLKSSIEALKKEEAGRGERFDKLAAEKDKRLKTLDERFKEEKKKVKESPANKPYNPFDND